MIEVIDEDGDPVVAEPIEVRRPAEGEWQDIETTDENGEVVLTGGRSEPDDAIMQEVRVRDQVITTYLSNTDRREQIVVSQPASGSENETTSPSETDTIARVPTGISV